MRSMEAISRLDATISAMCPRRAQLQTQVLSEQLCMYEVLAAHTREGSLLMQGRRDVVERGPPRRKRNQGSPAADTHPSPAPQVVAPAGAEGVEASRAINMFSDG